MNGVLARQDSEHLAHTHLQLTGGRRRRDPGADGRVRRGAPIEAASHISFEDCSTFFRIMSATRAELLPYIRANRTVPGMRALAQGLVPDYRRIQDDVAALVEAGLMERRGTGFILFWDGFYADIDPHCSNDLMLS
jgi:hypothetical protein